MIVRSEVQNMELVLACRRFISSSSFEGRKDKALDPFVFCFHPRHLKALNAILSQKQSCSDF
ncbi:hypothetical protein ABKV19_000102 [Rosa sericea]